MADQPSKTELIELLKSDDFTDERFYEIVTGDILDATSPGQLDRARGTVAYFRYKICEVLLPVIRQLREQQGATRGE